MTHIFMERPVRFFNFFLNKLIYYMKIFSIDNILIAIIISNIRIIFIFFNKKKNIISYFKIY